jgi:hypothetical protein
MSETPTAYDNDIPVRCPRCGVVLGYYQPMPHGEAWIRIGGCVLSEVHGYHACSADTWAEYHFVFTTKTLESLIRRIKG